MVYQECFRGEASLHCTPPTTWRIPASARSRAVLQRSLPHCVRVFRRVARGRHAMVYAIEEQELRVRKRLEVKSRRFERGILFRWMVRDDGDGRRAVRGRRAAWHMFAWLPAALLGAAAWGAEEVHTVPYVPSASSVGHAGDRSDREPVVAVSGEVSGGGGGRRGSASRDGSADAGRDAR